MSIILDTLRNYSGRTNDRQDITTNTTVYNQRICTGWGTIKPSGSSRHANTTVSLPITYDDTPIILAHNLGANNTSQPTDPSDLYVLSIQHRRVNLVTARPSNNSFRVYIQSISHNGTDPGNLPSWWFGFSWVTIGTYNDYD